jgi:hypothetical protein
VRKPLLIYLKAGVPTCIKTGHPLSGIRQPGFLLIDKLLEDMAIKSGTVLTIK